MPKEYDIFNQKNAFKSKVIVNNYRIMVLN